MTTVFDDSMSTGPTRVDTDVPGLEPVMPEQVGPYRLLDPLGQGGMGVVYRARDPRLEREVAIKLLRTDELGAGPNDRARARLVREARAMAHVTHPNVVAVFDVGTVGRQVFIAMELVEGCTLSQWIRQDPRSTAEILDLFAQAGRGLAAAHAKGLVHRDFKPDNVLVGKDGRVRVTDFGLARAIEAVHRGGSSAEGGDSGSPWSEDAEPAPREGSSQGTSDHLVTREDGLAPITRTGIAVGTPAYMAVEQHVAEPTDARCDQFAFCVALFEALAGHRPFVGTTARELARAKQQMVLREFPPRPGLRPAMVRAIYRGLAPEPTKRWPSMNDLLAVLTPPPQHLSWFGLGLGALAVTALIIWLCGSDPALPGCDPGAQVVQVWGPLHQAATSKAFDSSKAPLAHETWERVRTKLDDHLERWSASYRKACVTDRQRASDVDLDGRMRCLERHLARVGGLVTTFAEADPELVSRAVELVSSLPPAERCLEHSERERRPEPPNAQVATASAELEDQLQHVEILLEAHRGQQALELARTLHARARALDWPHIQGTAMLAVGSALQRVNDLDEAERVFVECHLLAEEHGLDFIAARAAALMTWLSGDKRLDEAEAQRWSRHAFTRIERIGGAPLVEASTHNALGTMYLNLGQADPAEDAFRRMLAIYVEELGPQHHHVALARSNLGATLAIKGDYEGSLEHLRAALTIWQGTLGPEHAATASALDNIALTYARLGRFADAIDTQQQALSLRRRTSDPDDLSIATSLNNLGAFEEELSHFDRAEAYHREANAAWEQALGPDDLRAVASRINLGLAILRQERHAEARVLADRAVAVLERVAPEHPYVIYAQVLQAGAAVRGGEGAFAAELAESVLERCEQAEESEKSICAEARYVLSRALGPEQRPRAIGLARAAADDLAPGSSLRKEVDAWRAELAPAPAP